MTMNQTQRNHMITRINELIGRKIQEVKTGAKLKAPEPAKRYSPEEYVKLLFSGEIKINKKAFNKDSVYLPQLNRAFPMPVHPDQKRYDRELKTYQAAMRKLDPRYVKIREKGKELIDAAMFSDAPEALKALKEFEKMKF